MTLNFETRVCLCRIGLLCFVVLVAFSRVLAQSPPSAASAEALIAAGHPDEALEQLNHLIQSPSAWKVEYLRGMAFYMKGEMLKASAAFAKAVEQDPANLDAAEMQGVSLFRAGRPAEATPLLERAHRSVPAANIDPNYVLGLCYIQTQRYDDARIAFAHQYGFAPKSAQAYLLEARMLLRQDYLPVAEEAGRKALALSPTLPGIHLLLGQIALAQSKISDAIAHFQQERDLDPLDGLPYERLADAYIRGGDFSRAQQALDQAILLEPNVSIPYILLGKVLLKQENPFMAKMYLERALQMDPRNSMAHFLLGRAYRSLGQKNDSTREFDIAAKIQAASAPKLESAQ
jgi:tetratricopeptide (TPR) repeat protein